MYKGRHDVLIEALKPLLKVCAISGENAGVHLLLTFKNGKTEEELVGSAKEKDIRVYGMSAYQIRRDREREEATILLGYANLSERQIREAVNTLTECWCPVGLK